MIVVFIMFTTHYKYSFSVCTIEWMTAVHDGPVQEISKCPFMPHLLMSVGGYSFAIWNEGVMVNQICFR